uniref:Uncharacterized protein n=1 Tax=Cannabis sativa TaxID=3483 RepID=A0A803NLG3_CANSA
MGGNVVVLVVNISRQIQVLVCINGGGSPVPPPRPTYHTASPPPPSAPLPRQQTLLVNRIPAPLASHHPLLSPHLLQANWTRRPFIEFCHRSIIIIIYITTTTSTAVVEQLVESPAEGYSGETFWQDRGREEAGEFLLTTLFDPIEEAGIGHG